MKRIFPYFFSMLTLCLIGVQTLSANVRSLSPVLSAEIPDDYKQQNLEKNRLVYFSPDRKTKLYVTKYMFSDLPSGWENAKKYDKNMLHLDTLKRLSDKHSYFWELNKSFRTCSYAFHNGDVITSDTRCIYPSLLINTIFVDETGKRGEVFDTYLATMTSTETLWDQLTRVVKSSRWFWIILAILVSIIGAVNHTDLTSILKYLKLAFFVSLIVGAFLCLLLWGEWALICLFMILTFLLTFFTAWFGFHLELD